MAKVYLYSTSDGVNVVHKDVGVQKAEITCDLLPDCTMANPRLLLSRSNVDLTKVNYFYLDTFGRYYFIEDYVIEGDTITLYMHVDVLYTYRMDNNLLEM